MHGQSQENHWSTRDWPEQQAHKDVYTDEYPFCLCALHFILSE